MTIVESTVTSKYQTTVPKQIRRQLAIEPQDVLRWELRGNEVRVQRAHRGFLARRGSVAVGAGSPVDDVRQARTLRGTEKA